MEIRENISLKDYSTFKIGSAAKFFCVAETLEDLQQALQWAQENNQKVFILGGGSNVLFPDEGLDGVAIKIKNSKIKIQSASWRTKFKNNEKNKVLVNCGAGLSLAKLVDFVAENGLTGLEWAAGIPGTVGGAIRGNAGAFGGEVKDSVFEVKAVDLGNWGSKGGRKIFNQFSNSNFQLTKFSNSDCEFGYRESIFKKNKNLIIWECVFELEKGDRDEIKNKIEKIKKSRAEKHPSLKDFPSCGSFFQNPVASEKVIKQFEQDKETKSKDGKVPAGWLIEQVGLKGFAVGGAAVSNKQANFIVNNKEATQKDVLILVSIIKQKVRNNFAVQLQEEVEIVY